MTARMCRASPPIGVACRGPIQRANVDLAAGMLEEPDRAARELNISRQAVIKTLIRQALDQQYLARGGGSRSRSR